MSMRKPRSARTRLPQKPPRIADARRRAPAEAIRRAITASATELLRALTPDQSIPKVLERIGRAADVSRVVVFRNGPGADGAVAAVLCYEWDGARVRPRNARTSPQRQMPLWDPTQLIPLLTKGEPIRLFARQMRKPLRAMMQSAGVKSALLVPIFVDTKWWGHICFDDCRCERKWTAAEADALRTLAEMIGAAIARARDLKNLADANRVVENSPVVLFRIAAQAPYPLLYLSQNVARFGYRAAELMASPGRYLDLFYPDDAPAMTADIRRIVNGDVLDITQERRLRRADGRYVWVEVRARLLTDARQDSEIEGILIDINDRRIAQDELARYSMSDPVTGLPNRKAFQVALEGALDTARSGGPSFAIHYIDLDRFKDVNDVLGHGKGDDLLRAVAKRLVGFSRNGHDLIARFGGDEFAVLQHNVTDPADASTFAQRVVHALSDPFDLGTEIHITASVGIAVFEADVPSAEEMLKRADVALYRAKDAGRNQFHFHSEALDQATIERVILGGDLRRAVERNELQLHYQPIVDVETGTIVGLEALARWYHPKYGYLAPKRFIPIAERNGTILALGDWVVDEVCRQIGEWRGANVAPPRISINISAEQLKGADFDRAIARRLAQAHIEPQALEIELTESVLMETTRQHGEIIDRLRALGLAIAIDDFGTGYSSLSYLRAYRVNHIKVAQEFIENIREGSGDLAIVRAAVSLGRELGIGVVAEGVETELQLDLLRQAGCRYVQGYLFSPPVSAADAAELLRRRVLTPQPLLSAKAESAP